MSFSVDIFYSYFHMLLSFKFQIFYSDLTGYIWFQEFLDPANNIVG